MLEELHENNAGTYWTGHWTSGRTQWRLFEASKPFMNNMRLALGHPAVAAGLCLAAAASSDDEVMAFVRGKSVFVPLCGDTYALRFFVDLGASVVVGVDLAEMGLRSGIESHFPASDGFRVVEEPLKSSTGDSDLGKQFHIFRESSDKACCVLYCCDLFEAPLSSYGFQIVYDRASMVALPPTLRDRYVLTLKRSMTTKENVLVVLELVHRRNGESQLTTGPPFHIPEGTVKALYDTHHRVSDVNDTFSITCVSGDAAEVEAFAQSEAVEGKLPFVFRLFGNVIAGTA